MFLVRNVLNIKWKCDNSNEQSVSNRSVILLLTHTKSTLAYMKLTMVKVWGSKRVCLLAYITTLCLKPYGRVKKLDLRSIIIEIS